MKPGAMSSSLCEANRYAIPYDHVPADRSGASAGHGRYATLMGKRLAKGWRPTSRLRGFGSGVPFAKRLASGGRALM